MEAHTPPINRALRDKGSVITQVEASTGANIVLNLVQLRMRPTMFFFLLLLLLLLLLLYSCSCNYLTLRFFFLSFFFVFIGVGNFNIQFDWVGKRLACGLNSEKIIITFVR